MDIIEYSFDKHLELIKTIHGSPAIKKSLKEVILLLVERIKAGSKLYICGNGGSATDALHIAAEFTGRFVNDRPPLPMLALNTNMSHMTAVSNDYGFEYVFSRMLDGLGKDGDVLIVLSTSGNSENLIKAIEKAKEKDLATIALLGKGGGLMKALADHQITIPSESTARIQEMHILLGHIICAAVENEIFPDLCA